MTYDQWKTRSPDDELYLEWPSDESEFCLIHGYEHMKYRPGHPIAYCAECEREQTISE